MVITNCIWCGKSIRLVSSRNKKYCGKECRSEHKISLCRVEKKCKICGVLFYVTPSKRKECCSPKCGSISQTIELPTNKIIAMYQDGKTLKQIGDIYNVSSTLVGKKLKIAGIELRKPNYWTSGKNNVMYGKKHTEESIQKMREANFRQFAKEENRLKHAEITAQQIADGRTGKSGNNLELLFAKILERIGIDFKMGFKLYRYAFDFKLSGYNILIECDGTFWHADPRFYKDKTRLSVIQNKNITNDRKKNALAERLGYKVLRFWEYDIHNNTELVISEITNAINSR